MDIKLIAIDLDGTLLDDDCLFQEENRKWIRRAMKAGYLVVPTTGRSYQNARYEIFKDFDELPLLYQRKRYGGDGCQDGKSTV